MSSTWSFRWRDHLARLVQWWSSRLGRTPIAHCPHLNTQLSPELLDEKSVDGGKELVSCLYYSLHSWFIESGLTDRRLGHAWYFPLAYGFGRLTLETYYHHCHWEPVTPLRYGLSARKRFLQDGAQEDERHVDFWVEMHEERYLKLNFMWRSRHMLLVDK